ncbi:3-phosphoshikimate 1-carboxyvinyltransferase [Aegicerativicinus sediminis]|uniref:3-phosphoshikimate 1-carboxyvinyltransferase n=1 Tax=Aegicerativicinus sediminis TaxID=2893202 RepID=UPI001E5AC732|nr:3-phosphoshikimate 1-carboxyvinyltransferase [Aegicerativicinus sediminis]
MKVKISPSEIISPSSLIITGSKSESNRLLLLQALFPGLQINNISNSEDSEMMSKGISGNRDVVDIHHAGTAMRFLTAYFASRPNRNVILTGSSRMQERPIAVLVDALNSLGAEITYLKTEGCPPLKISGKELTNSKVSMKANVSSQYISALMLIAPSLPNGLEITLVGEITSVPYIKMTQKLLQDIGVECNFSDHVITIESFQNKVSATFIVESDWSSASYFYSIVALGKPGTEIGLQHYKLDSLQGDSILIEIYEKFGVETSFRDNKMILKKLMEVENASPLQLDLRNAPDIAQTIAVTCLGLGRPCYLTGLHTLKIKETDRLEALRIEIEKLGGTIKCNKDSLKLEAIYHLKEDVEIDTYNDHRMAMAFAPLGIKIPLQINDAEVVNKSYPDYWKDLESIGFKISS